MPHRHRIDERELIVKPGSRVKLRERDARRTPGLKDRETAEAAMAADKTALAGAQEKLWASQTHGVLIVFQAMDAAGKDGTIKHVLSGVNPQGVDVRSFKAPSDEERMREGLAALLDESPLEPSLAALAIPTGSAGSSPSAGASDRAGSACRWPVSVKAPATSSTWRCVSRLSSSTSRAAGRCR